MAVLFDHHRADQDCASMAKTLLAGTDTVMKLP
jgi:hypothetical protein